MCVSFHRVPSRLSSSRLLWLASIRRMKMRELSLCRAQHGHSSRRGSEGQGVGREGHLLFFPAIPVLTLCYVTRVPDTGCYISSLRASSEGREEHREAPGFLGPQQGKHLLAWMVFFFFNPFGLPYLSVCFSGFMLVTSWLQDGCSSSRLYIVKCKQRQEAVP